uniref:Uncharacterized protein n=2 Tax=unclassified bacterial viruses TaxID=12333 RepID=A0A8S5R7N6_9VIRU|nr:MAG TPA: hypothetical protein [virus sp. cthq354]DAE27623.1 MAG TPA: hypothetical protein [virus sp. ctf7E27]
MIEDVCQIDIFKCVYLDFISLIFDLQFVTVVK